MALSLAKFQHLPASLSLDSPRVQEEEHDARQRKNGGNEPTFHAIGGFQLPQRSNDLGPELCCIKIGINIFIVFVTCFVTL